MEFDYLPAKNIENLLNSIEIDENKKSEEKELLMSVNEKDCIRLIKDLYSFMDKEYNPKKLGTSNSNEFAAIALGSVIEDKQKVISQKINELKKSGNLNCDINEENKWDYIEYISKMDGVSQGTCKYLHSLSPEIIAAIHIGSDKLNRQVTSQILKSFGINTNRDIEIILSKGDCSNIADIIINAAYSDYSEKTEGNGFERTINEAIFPGENAKLETGISSIERKDKNEEERIANNALNATADVIIKSIQKENNLESQIKLIQKYNANIDKCKKDLERPITREGSRWMDKHLGKIEENCSKKVFDEIGYENPLKEQFIKEPKFIINYMKIAKYAIQIRENFVHLSETSKNALDELGKGYLGYINYIYSNITIETDEDKRNPGRKDKFELIVNEVFGSQEELFKEINKAYWKNAKKESQKSKIHKPVERPDISYSEIYNEDTKRKPEVTEREPFLQAFPEKDVDVTLGIDGKPDYYKFKIDGIDYKVTLSTLELSVREEDLNKRKMTQEEYKKIKEIISASETLNAEQREAFESKIPQLDEAVKKDYLPPEYFEFRNEFSVIWQNALYRLIPGRRPEVSIGGKRGITPTEAQYKSVKNIFLTELKGEKLGKFKELECIFDVLMKEKAQ